LSWRRDRFPDRIKDLMVAFLFPFGWHFSQSIAEKENGIDQKAG
jgi:hypothetical protein